MSDNQSDNSDEWGKTSASDHPDVVKLTPTVPLPNPISMKDKIDIVGLAAYKVAMWLDHGRMVQQKECKIDEPTMSRPGLTLIVGVYAADHTLLQVDLYENGYTAFFQTQAQPHHWFSA